MVPLFILKSTHFLFRYDQKKQDAIAVALEYGNADLFITVTGDPNIDEIRRIANGISYLNISIIFW